MDKPPRTRPKSRMGKLGTVMHMHAIAYVTQNTMQRRLRPLINGIQSGIEISGEWIVFVLLVGPSSNQRGCEGSRHEAGHKKQGNHSFWKCILFGVQGVHVWALEPVRTWG